MLGMTRGGETGLNFTNKKNMLALFSAPRKVLINLKFLNTLPEREFNRFLGVGSLDYHLTEIIHIILNII